MGWGVCDRSESGERKKVGKIAAETDAFARVSVGFVKLEKHNTNILSEISTVTHSFHVHTRQKLTLWVTLSTSSKSSTKSTWLVLT